MYTIYDYAYNGLLYLNNIMRPRHKRLSQLMIYSTTACQSRCKHCNIWQKKVEHLSLDEIFNSVTSCQTQCHYSKNCNGCWINFHRLYSSVGLVLGYLLCDLVWQQFLGFFLCHIIVQSRQYILKVSVWRYA